MTKSLSRQNLFKSNHVFLNDDGVRVIDTNELVASKIKMLSASYEQFDVENFSDQMDPDHVAKLLVESDSEKQEFNEDGFRVNVIKAQKAEPVYNGPDPNELLEQAMEEIQEMKRQALLEIEQERQATLSHAREEGKRDGYQAGYQDGLSKIDILEKELAQKEEQLYKEYDQMINTLEPKFVETITRIYEHVFHVELNSYRGIITHLVGKALRNIEGSRDYIVHVSREDYPFVSMQKQMILAEGVAGNATVEFVEDFSVAKNECLIETDNGIFDCSLGIQLQELSRELRLLSFSGKED